MAVRLRVKELAEKQGFNISSLSRKSDVSQNTMRRYGMIHIGITNINSSLDLIKEMLYNLRMDMFVALADPTRRHILELLPRKGKKEGI